MRTLSCQRKRYARRSRLSWAAGWLCAWLLAANWLAPRPGYAESGEAVGSNAQASIESHASESGDAAPSAAATAADAARMQRLARQLARGEKPATAADRSPSPAPSPAPSLKAGAVDSATKNLAAPAIAASPASQVNAKPAASESLPLGQSIGNASPGGGAVISQRLPNQTAGAKQLGKQGESGALPNKPIGLAPAPSSSQASLGGSGEGSSLTGGWVNTFAALAIVIVLILLVRSLIAKWTGTPMASRTGAVEVLARVPVAPRQHVLLLRMGQRVLVVGDSQAGGLRTLADINDPDEIAGVLTSVATRKPNSISQGFSQLFNRFESDYGDDADETQLDKQIGTGGDDDEFVTDDARDQLRGLLSRVRSMGRREGRK